MLKQKISIAVALALIGTTAMAAQSGFYVGGRLGYESGEIKSNEAYTTTDPSLINTTYSSYLSDYVFGAYAGYDQFFSPQFVLGGEIFANRSNAQATWKTNLSATQREFQKISTIGISVLPGWQFNTNNRLYARLGWAQAEFDYENNNAGIYGPSFHAKERSGLETGLGWLTQLTEKLALRLEYDHFNYDAFKTVYSTSTNSGNFHYQPNFDQFTAGVSYYFNPNALVNTAQLVTLGQGLYIGADAGRSNSGLKIYDASTSGTPEYNYSLQGYTGGLHLGYRWQILPKFNLTAETFADTNTGEMNYRKTEYILDPPTTVSLIKLREKNSIGLSLLPGFNITPSSNIYARLGIINSEFIKSSNDQTTPDFKVGQHGVEIGAGYEMAVTTHWSVLGEYDHSKYATINTRTNNNSLVSYSPEDNLYKVSVNYYF